WWGIQASAALQSLPPNQVSATRTYTNKEILGIDPIAPAAGQAGGTFSTGGLTRNLAAGATGTYSVSLIAPGTVYSDRLNQLDLPTSKVFKIGGTRRLQINAALYNALNVATPLSRITTYGDNWLKPSTMEVGRFVKFGAQFNF